ncbi:Predicted protein [Taphrina deformans PYCC 5710]|uniref:25S rRNA (Uridine(2843)-N(3))-methyltransferase n=1 Tax=Taphrina deformans (strain PYCC 5710 / ATCC 11124 / CBS 356.35 / IMI 108563 / JCM 9778 / NBRC 8474) TaxID=1097556 RepID=R4X923_TAPDE|nr:Predicted protein [Taphrina deformans PYCC 5710]|eukprot:CCG80657.1 Predicted protein [Taphrina deformans PYCC 5710]
MGSHHKRNEGLKPIRRTAAKPKPEKKAKAPQRDESAIQLLQLQQSFLDHLSTLFHPTLADDHYDKKLQAIKGHFFRREYAKVFNDPASCIIYSVRYLPSRSFAYAELFSQRPILDLLYPRPPPRRPSERTKALVLPRKRVVAVGAGVGSELCALHLLNQSSRAQLDEDDEDMKAVLDHDMQIDIIDSADYEVFLTDLNVCLSQQLSQESSSEEIVRTRLQFNYYRHDILKWSTSTEFAAILADTTLLTFMFVFNELFAASKVETMRLIAAIAQNLTPGSHVLLIESAGELSQVKLDRKRVTFDQETRLADLEGEHEEGEEAMHEQQQKSLMVYKFWDHLPGFEKVVSEDRRWYRLDPSLKYPLEMENVGYFVRLYRKAA